MRSPLLVLTVLCDRLASAAGWTWSKPPLVAGTAPRVSGQATASSTDENGVLLFGGLTGAAGSPTTNDLWHFGDDAWAKLSPDGASPRVRMYAASSTVGEKFFVFGGWDPMEPGSGGEFLDDIWSYDRTTETWKEEEAKLPFPVSRHAGVTVGDMAVIHTYKGIFTFKDGALTEQECGGEAPDSLSMCAMTAVGDKVILFGGSDKNQQMSSDVYVLDTTTWTWTKLKCEDGPAAMASACMVPLSDDQFILFGGAGLAPAGYQGGYGLLPMDDTWICTVAGEDAEWERAECAERPGGRVAASLNALGGGRFLLQGGYDPVSKATFEEPWILSTD